MSTFITLLVTSIGGWLALREYRLKAKAETRLAESAELESDIKLIKIFTEIMDIAHARSGYKVSEKAIEVILSSEALEQLNQTGGNVRDILHNSIVCLPVGVAAQDAAISAIWTLGKKHEILAPIALQALVTLSGFKSEVVMGYLDDFKKQYSGKILAVKE